MVDPESGVLRLARTAAQHDHRLRPILLSEKKALNQGLFLGRRGDLIASLQLESRETLRSQVLRSHR